MKSLKSRNLKLLSYGILFIIVIAGCLSFSSYLTEPYAHISPNYPQINIIPILSKENLNDQDYRTLFYQTGLGKTAIDEFRGNLFNSTQRILSFQQDFFSNIKYVCEKNSLISREEYVVDAFGHYINGAQIAPLYNGYILITKSSHTYGWRNGHAALVVDAANGKTLESAVLGTNSCIQDISKWTNYPNFILLKLKGASQELQNEIAKSALKNLNNIPYNLTIGIFSPKFEKAGLIKGTHCSHLVWESFRLFGYDLDSDGGMIVTPKDIANSPLLEVVQVFGVNPKEIWP